MGRFAGERLKDTIYRICGELYEPWAFRDWAAAKSDGTFGCRWDDPAGEYRVLYASTNRTGAFMETLQCFIPPPELVALVGAIASTQADGPATIAPGVVPREWASERVIGSCKAEGNFAAVFLARSLQVFRGTLAALITRLGLKDLDYDLSALLLRSPRELSQAASRVVYEDTEDFSGIFCVSRMGFEFMNVTIYERPDGKRAPEAPARAAHNEAVIRGS